MTTKQDEPLRSLQEMKNSNGKYAFSTTCDVFSEECDAVLTFARAPK
jgi:hypothetical protein